MVESKSIGWQLEVRSSFPFHFLPTMYDKLQALTLSCLHNQQGGVWSIVGKQHVLHTNIFIGEYDIYNMSDCLESLSVQVTSPIVYISRFMDYIHLITGATPATEDQESAVQLTDIRVGTAELTAKWEQFIGQDLTWFQVFHWAKYLNSGKIKKKSPAWIYKIEIEFLFNKHHNKFVHSSKNKPNWQDFNKMKAFMKWRFHFNGLVQERRNSSALAMELRLSCVNPLINLSKNKLCKN